jgi:hypothetical protein
MAPLSCSIRILAALSSERSPCGHRHRATSDSLLAAPSSVQRPPTHRPHRRLPSLIVLPLGKTACKVPTSVQISHTFFHLLPLVFAQMPRIPCQRNRHKNRNKRHHRRRSSATHRNSPQIPKRTAIYRQNPANHGNRSQLPTKTHANQRKRENYRTIFSLYSLPSCYFLINKLRPTASPQAPREGSAHRFCARNHAIYISFEVDNRELCRNVNFRPKLANCCT